MIVCIYWYIYILVYIYIYGKAYIFPISNFRGSEESSSCSRKDMQTLSN